MHILCVHVSETGGRRRSRGGGTPMELGLLGGGGVSGTGAWFESMGIRHGRLMAAAAGGTELMAGALFAVGLLTPFAAAGIAATMLVAAATDHGGKGFWIYNGGKEYVLTIATIAIGVAFNGAGEWSIDAALGLGLSGVPWGLGAAGAAAAGAVTVLGLFRERPVLSA